MSFLKNIFSKKDEPVKTYSDFWEWFKANEKDFYTAVKNRKDIEKQFFDKLSPKLRELKEGFFYLTGMYDDNIVELVLTADGNIKNIVFIEELVEKAPAIEGWRFTALKPALDIEDVNIEMAGFRFNGENLFFYSNDFPDYPDEIDISIVHNDLNENNKQQIINGVHIFLDNYLGELDFANNIDSLKVIGRKEADKELIPIAKLKSYLTWRQKEFIERYGGIRYNTENDKHSILQAKLENGNSLLATVNTQLLNWDRKASHPWIATMVIKFDGSKTHGMPGDAEYQDFNKIEETIMQELKDKDGYLNIGRQTADCKRELYFACKDFRKPSKIYNQIQKQYGSSYEIEFDIYKDKYWQSFERFNNN